MAGFDDEMYDAASSPARRRVEAHFGLSTPPLKRRRLEASTPQMDPFTATSLTSATPMLVSPPSFSLQQPFQVAEPQTTAVHQSGSLTSTTPQSTTSLSSIEAQAHENRLLLQKQMTEGKGTDEAYRRHVKDYEKFWEASQNAAAKKDPSYVHIPAHPIVGAKVALFLQHEISRPKRNHRSEDVAGTSIGKESIKQTISALQRYMREHQHLPEYANCEETRIPLRNQDWVKLYETAACASEPSRIRKAHVMKAKGTSADVYTIDELIRMSMWGFQAFGPTSLNTHLGIRDRAMLLISTSIAFRGDSCRRLLWSDIFTQQQPMEIIAPDFRLDALVFLADQAKTNTTGRVDEHGLFRHKNPEVCGFGAIAFLLFSHFHILGCEPPSFAPDFDDKDHTEFGRRDWYGQFLFPGKEKDSAIGTVPMTYANHRDRINNMHKQNDVSISKVTHGGRFYSADTAAKHGAASMDIKALGNWKTGDAYSEIYNRALPTRAMLAAATFNAERPEYYRFARGCLEPPADLLAKIFPWVEAEQDAYHIRTQTLGNKAIDHSLKHFLQLLIALRSILLQDAAILFVRYPTCAVWNFAPFDSEMFRNFASSAQSRLDRAERETRERLERLPFEVAESMRGIMETTHIRHEAERADLNAKLDFVTGLMMNKQGSISRGSSKGKTTNEAVHFPSNLLTISPLHTPSPPPCPTPPPLSTHSSIPQATPPPIPSITPSTLPAVSESVNSLWPGDLLHLQRNFRLLSSTHELQAQLEGIRSLMKKYGERIEVHQFEWMSYSSGSIKAEWLPIYEYRKVKTLQDVWDEYTNGLDGFLSVSQLNAGWAARWRRNNSGAKTESARRKQVITLIEKLVEKPNWNAGLALRFLSARYPVPHSDPSRPHLKSVRAFVTHLQNKATGQIEFNNIIAASNSFT